MLKQVFQTICLFFPQSCFRSCGNPKSHKTINPTNWSHFYFVHSFSCKLSQPIILFFSLKLMPLQAGDRVYLRITSYAWFRIEKETFHLALIKLNEWDKTAATSWFVALILSFLLIVGVARVLTKFLTSFNVGKGNMLIGSRSSWSASNFQNLLTTET